MGHMNERPDPRRHGFAFLDLQRCAGCRRKLDAATMEERANPIEEIVFYICRVCWERTGTDPAFAERIDGIGKAWAEMNLELKAYQGLYHDVL